MQPPPPPPPVPAHLGGPGTGTSEAAPWEPGRGGAVAAAARGGQAAAEGMRRGGRPPSPPRVKAGCGRRGALEVGDGAGGSGRTRPSAQVGGEGDAGGARAPEAAAPCRLGRRCPPCPWPRWGVRGGGGGATGPPSPRDLRAAAGRLQTPMLAVRQVTARHR